MRRQFVSQALVAGAAVFSFAPSFASAQLVNGNLDATQQVEVAPGFFLPQPASWQNIGTRSSTGPFVDGLSSEPWAGPAPTPVTANDQGVFFKPFQGVLSPANLLTVHLRQNTPGVAGQTYTLTGWAGAESGFSGFVSGSPTQALFALDFLNGSNGLISSSTLDLIAAGLATANGNAFNYKQFSVSGTAPAGTATVRARISLIDAYNNSGGQAFVVDDFTLAVPEPTTFAVVAAGALVTLARRRRG